jgi:hypothetical protein
VVHFNAVAEGLSAILNSGLPEADSIFNIFCAHSWGGILNRKEMIVFFDISVPWTQAWVNGNPVTGYSYIDSLVSTHGFEVHDYAYYSSFPPSFQHRVLISSPHVVNIDGALDAFIEAEGITIAEVNSTGGEEVSFDMNISGTGHTFTIRHQWTGCFGGCIQGFTWTFLVGADCTVQLIDRLQTPIFSTPPMPNCQIVSGVKELGLSEPIRIFPNPATEIITVETDAANVGTLAIIFDQYGRRVKEVYLNKEAVQVPINDLAAGIYWLQISSRSAQPQKIVKL